MAGGKRDSNQARLDQVRHPHGAVCSYAGRPALLFGILAIGAVFKYAVKVIGLGVCKMRFLLKIICAPVVAVLAIIAWFFAFLLNLSAFVFGIAGTVFGVLGAIILFTDSVMNGIIVLAIAFLVSPFGLPMLAAWLVGGIQQLRFAIQDRVYG